MEEAALAGLLHEIVNYAESKSFPSQHLHDEIDRLLKKAQTEPEPPDPAEGGPVDPDVSYTADETAAPESFGTESQPE